MRATNAKPVEKDAAVLLWVRRENGKRGQHMNDRRISNLQWAMSVLEELPTETIEQDRAIDIGISAIQDKIDSLCEQEDKPWN